jgi:hypothetical protein
MPLKKSVRSKASAGAKKPSPSKAMSGKIGAGVILMAVMSVAVVAMLMAARESSDTAAITTADAQPQMAAEGGAKKIAAVRPSAAVPSAMPTTGVMDAGDHDADAAPGS